MRGCAGIRKISMIKMANGGRSCDTRSNNAKVSRLTVKREIRKMFVVCVFFGWAGVCIVLLCCRAHREILQKENPLKSLLQAF